MNPKFFFLIFPFLMVGCNTNKEKKLDVNKIDVDTIYVKSLRSLSPSDRIDTLKNIIKTREDSMSLAKAYLLLSDAYMDIPIIDSCEEAIHMAMNFLPHNHRESGTYANILFQNYLINMQKDHSYIALHYLNSACEVIMRSKSIRAYPWNPFMIIFNGFQEDRHNFLFTKSLELNRFFFSNISLLTNAKPSHYFVGYLNMALCYSHQTIYQPDSVKKYMMLADSIILEDYFKKEDIQNRNNYYSVKANILYNRHNYDSALQCQKKVLFSNFSAADSLGEYINFAGLYDRIGNYADAESNLQQAAPLLKYANLLDSLNYMENLLATRIGKEALPATVRLFFQFADKKNEYLSNESRRAISEMSTLYDLQQKDMSINKLNYMVDKTQVLLRKRNVILVLLGVLALLSSMFVMLLLSRAKRQRLEVENERMQEYNRHLDMEQRLLRSQMNPHFVFNGLGSVQSFIRQGETDKAIDYISRFSSILRTTLQGSRAHTNSLSDELKLADDYLSLQQSCFEDPFNYEISLGDSLKNEDLDDIIIPSFLVQPFLENAVIHGLKNISHTGMIKLYANMENDMLTIIIADNGKGIELNKNISHAAANEIHATQIARERVAAIAKATGCDAGISITGANPTGVIVKIVVPINGV